MFKSSYYAFATNFKYIEMKSELDSKVVSQNNILRLKTLNLNFYAHQWSNGMFSIFVITSSVSKTHFCQWQSLFISNVTFIKTPRIVICITVAKLSRRRTAIVNPTFASWFSESIFWNN